MEGMQGAWEDKVDKVLAAKVDMDNLGHKGEEEEVVEFFLGHKGENKGVVAFSLGHEEEEQGEKIWGP